MKTIRKQKRAYVNPTIKRIQLDNEISLVMQSDPMGNPPWGMNGNPTSSPNPFRDEEFSC